MLLQVHLYLILEKSGRAGSVCLLTLPLAKLAGVPKLAKELVFAYKIAGLK